MHPGPAPTSSLDTSSHPAPSSASFLSSEDPPSSSPISDHEAQTMMLSLDQVLSSLEEELERYEVEMDATRVDLSFRYPPNATLHKPIDAVDAEEVNTGQYSILDNHPANQGVLEYERWLLESIVLVDRLSQTVPLARRLRLVVFRQYLDKAFSRLEMWKETEWHRQRRSNPPLTRWDAAKNGSSDDPVVVNTSAYQDPPWKRSKSVNLLLRIVGAVLLLLCRVSIPKCNWILRSLKVAFSLGFKAACGDNLSGTPLHIVDDIPQDIRDVISSLDLAPVTETFVSCPSCSYLYPVSSPYPERCTYKRAPDSKPCNRRLRLTRSIAGKPRTFPAGQYVHQDFNHWLGRMFWSPGLEAIVDRDVLDPDGYTAGVHRDVWDTLTFRAFKGADGKPFVDPKVREGRYIFGICMDGFNAEGKGGAVRPLTAVYLVWFNLPPELRFKYEYMYLAGVLAGHPSQEQINHLLRPLVTCFCDSYLRGVRFTLTPMHPDGKLSRCAIIPIIADLLAARQMAGFAPHNHTNFCSLCTQKLGEIEELDYRNWTHRCGEEHRRIAEKWRDAPTEELQDQLYETFGVRWSELLRLPYWDATKFVALDSMHMFYLGDFQRHCEQVWGMGGKYRDGLDGIAYDPEKKPPNSHELKDAVKTLRTGSEPELAKLRTEVLRTLCKDNGLRFPKKKSRLVEILVKFRIDQGWFDNQGNLVVPDQDLSSPQNNPQVPPLQDDVDMSAQPQAVPGHADSKELHNAFETLRLGNKTAVSRMPVASVKSLCQALIPSPAVGWDNLNKAELLKLLHQYRRDNGITDDKDKLLPKAPTPATAAALGEMAVAEDTLRHGSMTQLRRLPTLTLISLSTQTQPAPLNPPVNKIQALEQLQDYRVRNGIEQEEGGLVRPRNTRTRILGRDRLKLIWDDMSKTTYPSWFSLAPPRVAATGNSSGMKADQWRSYCCAHLPISLLNCWGCADPTSREYKILANFMDLVSSVKLASKRRLTPNVRATYRTYMHRYLENLLQLFPGATISPNQHLSLHWPDVAEKVGPSHATRCFAFEHNNFLLQQIQTNHRVDDLSGTLLRRFCMQQNLRLMINDQDLPQDLGSVVFGFVDTFRSKAAMSLLAATLGYDDHLDEFASNIEDDFLSSVGHRGPKSPIRSQTLLPEEIYGLFQEWWRAHQAGLDSKPVLPFARMLTEAIIDGVEYTTYRKRPRDCHIVMNTEDGHDWQAGRIREIFEHTQHHNTQLFLVVDCFKPLTEEHARRDPCRAFPIAGGRLFYRAMLSVPRIVRVNDVLGHFASIDRILPEESGASGVEKETIDCIHVMPLDKW